MVVIVRCIGILVVVGQHIAYLIVGLGECCLISEGKTGLAPRLSICQLADKRIFVVLGTLVIVDEEAPLPTGGGFLLRRGCPLLVVVGLGVVVLCAENIDSEFLIAL